MRTIPDICASLRTRATKTPVSGPVTRGRREQRSFFGAVSQVFNFNIFFGRARRNGPDEILRPGVRFQRPRHKCVAASKS